MRVVTREWVVVEMECLAPGESRYFWVMEVGAEGFDGLV